MPGRRAKNKPPAGPESGWKILAAGDDRIESFCSSYRQFLSQVKTEREAVDYLVEQTAGRDRIACFTNRGKAVAFCRPGTARLAEGVRIVVAHLDSPRLDLKANPLYEDTQLAMLKTHYYGGIKKYQWLARPLALHGVVVREDGSRIGIVIGEDENDPCFTIDDLLPHLAGKVQSNKKVSDAFVGEKLNLICGSRPDDKVQDEAVKRNVLQLLKEKYGLVEQDFVSADLEVVPCGPAREVGLDRALIGAYGQDDRACAFSAYRALLDADNLPQGTIVLLVDREETGSDGNTGAKSMFTEEVLWDLGRLYGEDIVPTRVLFRSRAISGDANAALDPDYPDVHEKTNAARLGYGVCLTKYTGSRGKYGTSEAHAEYMGWIRAMLNRRKVPWQTGELGRVDEGGGGTVAKFLAEYGMDIVDMGPALLSMHSPFEIASKVDIYSTYLAYRGFMEEE